MGDRDPTTLWLGGSLVQLELPVFYLSGLWGEGVRRTLTTRDGVYEWQEKSSPYVLGSVMDPENQIIKLLVTLMFIWLTPPLVNSHLKCGSLVSAI